MDIRELKYFISAAECLNFTKAAKECYITQTAMSQNIASMERELGFRLFERNNRNVQLTPAGLEFYKQMKNIVQNYENAVRHSKNQALGIEGRLSITCSSWLDGLVFMPRLKLFQKQYPSVKITINLSPPRRIPEMLRRAECDIAICWPHDLDGNDTITVQNLSEFKGTLICSKDHPLASHENVTMEDLAKEQLLMLDLASMPGTYRAMCNDWKKLGILPPSITAFEQIDHLEELLLAISLHDTVAIVPEFARNYIGENIVMKNLKLRTPVLFKICTAHLENSQNPLIGTALDFLHDNRIPLNY